MFYIADITLQSDHLLSFTTRWQFKIDVPDGTVKDFSRDYTNDIRFLAEKHVGKLLEQKASEVIDVKVLLSSETEDLEYNTLSKTGPKTKHQM